MKTEQNFWLLYFLLVIAQSAQDAETLMHKFEQMKK